ncbi:Beta-lactamase-like protein [Penicillium rolfsii]|nr:Beta-lactamase-like protein [Penicillium rolfsii]
MPSLTSSLMFLSLALFNSVSAQSSHYCPLLGPIYPPPTNLSNDPTFAIAAQNITSILNQVTRNGSLSTSSISVQIFDATQTGSLLTFAYTADNINTTLGVSKVDQDTVFRVGSVSKLWTMVLFLVEEGLWPFQEPVARFIPELARAAGELQWHPRKGSNSIDDVDWGHVSMGELASHLAGIARDYGVLDLSKMASQLEPLGFPVLQPSEIPPCGNPNPCSRKQFFNGLLQSHPIVPTSSTPIYSNAAFQILAYALEAMTNQSYTQLLQRDIIAPLGLNRTYYTTPNISLGVIPNDSGEYWWNFDLGDEGPAGGIYSSTRDMATLGQAILSNSLFPSFITRRWMKPAAHTSSLDYSVGAPWEIVSFGDERPIDIYSKAGDIGSYSSIIALSPDHNVGFTVLAAGADGHAKVALAADLVSGILLPALEKSAKEQAAANFAGHYAAANGVNSSIALATDRGPGLLITTWVNNGTDMIQSLMTLGHVTVPHTFSIRLYPTGLESPGQLSFRALMPPTLSTAGNGPFTSSCISWVAVGGQVYGNVGIDEFIFNLDEKGVVRSITPRVLRTTLPKV